MTYLLLYLILLLTLSLLSFLMYGLDKQRAGNGHRRIPEQTLHLIAFCGGWPGAWIGQRYFRHKTKKAPFLIVFWSLVLLHVTIVLYLASLIW